MKEILVIGGAGYLGQTVCDLLYRKGYGVRVLVRPEDSIDRLPPSTQVTRGSIMNQEDIRHALGSASLIVNCAVMMPDRLNRLPWKLFHETNNVGSQNLLEVAAEREVERVILISTAGVLGKNPRTGIYDDEAPLRNGYNYYLQSKIDFENWLTKNESRVFPRWVILRPSSIYGPGPSFKWPQVMDMVRQGKAAILGDGSCLHPLVDVRDLAEAVLTAIEAPVDKVASQRMTISDCSLISVRDVMEAVQRKVGGGAFRHVPGRLALFASYAVSLVPRSLRSERLSLLSPGNVREYTVSRVYDPKKAERLLGFKTRIPFEQGIEETLNYHMIGKN